jgi:hypothetical protein
MNADQYHEVLLGLDRVLDLFDRPGVYLSPDDTNLQLRLRLLRSDVLKAESGHPFPSFTDPSFLLRDPDPDLTRAPWQGGFEARK